MPKVFNRKTLFYPTLVLLVLMSACKKNNDTDGNGGGGSAQLIPAKTGWQTVSTIPYQNAVSGFEGANSMTPYDLTLVGNELALLYSDNYKMFAVDGHTIMKVMLNNGAVDVKTKAIKLNYDRGGNAVQIHRFIPGSFTTVSVKFFNNECLLYDEAGGPNAGQNFGSINALPTIRWYNDGSVLAGLNDGVHSSASWSYKYPAIGNFNYVLNVWNGDSTANLLSAAMKLTDGRVYDMVFTRRNSTMYFSVMRNLNPPQTGTATNYEMICRNAVPDLDAGKSYAIVTNDVQGDVQTIVLAEVNYTGGNTVYSKLIAFRWQKGASTLEKLYSVSITDNDLSRKIMELTTNTSFENEIRLTPDGTAYFLREYRAPQSAATDYTALVLINKEGIKEIGKIGMAEMQSIKRGQFGLHCCRYLKGSYYAVVHPIGESDYDIHAPEFRIELVKINP